MEKPQKTTNYLNRRSVHLRSFVKLQGVAILQLAHAMAGPGPVLLPPLAVCRLCCWHRHLNLSAVQSCSGLDMELLIKAAGVFDSALISIPILPLKALVFQILF
jgi:hypothetical protein